MLKLLKRLFGRKPKVVAIVPAEPRYVTVKVLKDRQESFEIGRTTVKITFNDGRTFVSAVYGLVDQYVNNGQSYCSSHGVELDPRVSPVSVLRSLEMAQNLLKNIRGHEVVTYEDDSRNPRSATTGLVQSIEILKSAPYKVDHKVYFIEEEQKLLLEAK